MSISIIFAILNYYVRKYFPSSNRFGFPGTWSTRLYKQKSLTIDNRVSTQVDGSQKSIDFQMSMKNQGFIFHLLFFNQTIFSKKQTEKMLLIGRASSGFKNKQRTLINYLLVPLNSIKVSNCLFGRNHWKIRLLMQIVKLIFNETVVDQYVFLFFPFSNPTHVFLLQYLRFLLQGE